ncbi:hypothetical protein [Desulfospira joergensenii]|uniref:hypothetical protein n=1 Tax=Desulfospira joergensenii TaxID=53329 RepID=UPI0004810C01|nr:hypothetical protein [Desulfospira joergensenii]
MEKFQCVTCGKISSNRGEICNAGSDIGSVFVCSDCSKRSSRAEDICNPVEMTPSFYCGKCGNSAVEEGALCDPLKL